MVVQELLNQIQELGYTFELVGDGIKFTYTKGNQTPREAISILKQFKERKQEVVDYLQKRSKLEVQKQEKPTIQHYEPTERDRELERYIGKPSLNPNGYNCITCGAIGERYCLAFSNGRWWWGWQCLKCRPYNEPERN